MAETVSSSVVFGAPIVGSIPVTPVTTVDAVLASTSSDEAKDGCVLGWIDSAELTRVVFAPLREPSATSYLRVSSRSGYQVDVPSEEVEALARELLSRRVVGAGPVVLSGRGRWAWSPTEPPLGRIEIFHAAAVVAGHRDVGAYAKAHRDAGFRARVPFVLFPKLTMQEEEALYGSLQHHGAKRAGNGARTPRSDAPKQLRIGTGWTEVEIVSEPFVLLTGLGYTAVLMVEEIASGERLGLYAGARTLARELELIRDAVGRLTGTRIRVRKTGTDRRSGYEVRLS